jgi:hypothetical protein
MLRGMVIESVSHGITASAPYFISSTLYLEDALTNLKHIGVSGGYSYAIRFFYYLAHFINITLCYLLPLPLACASLWYLQNKKVKKGDKTIVLFFLLWSALTFPKALARSSMSHLVQSLTPSFFLILFLLQKCLKQFKANKASLEKYMTYGLLTTTLVLLVPTPLFFMEIGYRLTAPFSEFGTKYGTLLHNNASELKDIGATIDFIHKNTEEGDYMFVTPPFTPPFYALTNRKNPTYYDWLPDVVYRSSNKKQIKICNDILTKDTKLIIHTPHWEVDGIHFLDACPILQRCIEDNFNIVAKYGRYWLWLPKKT